MSEQHRQRTIRARLSAMSESEVPSIPTGLPFGPLPRGSIVEIFGPSASGKTSVALAIAASCQQHGGAAAWIDADCTFDPAYASSLGVAVDRLPVAQPASAEQAFAMAQKLALSRAVDLLIVDPAAALVPALELETGIGASGPGLQSRVLAAGLRNLAGTLKRTQATAMFLNQTRSRAGDEELSAGGPALKLHAAVRIALEAAGKAGRTRFRVLKNKVGERFLQGELLWISPRELGEVP